MNRKPYSKDELIVNAVMWRNIIGQSVWQIIVLLTLLFFGQNIFNLPFDPETPFYATDDWLAANPDGVFTTANPTTALVKGDATNKCYLYTIVFQVFVFLQLFN